MHRHHLTLNGRPYCDHLGCVAGLDLARLSGVDQCTHATKAAAEHAATAVRRAGGYGPNRIKVVAGDCPAAPE